jgi:hypothetical protein
VDSSDEHIDWAVGGLLMMAGRLLCSSFFEPFFFSSFFGVGGLDLRSFLLYPFFFKKTKPTSIHTKLI